MNKLTIGCVGKPSAGKSSFLNAATDAAAKTGNYPFTTIDPNLGVTYYPTPCPCKRVGRSSDCAPRYGRCEDGTRYIPVQVLDVAGLVPGASTGEGLGNRFLNDLCGADVLLHVVDVSGTTNAKGEVTTGYDPSADVAWLKGEIHNWLFNNLWSHWGGLVRKFLATKTPYEKLIQTAMSGYGAKLPVIQASISRGGPEMKESIENWSESTVHAFIDAFMEERFPIILVLNKIDTPDSDKNIEKVCKLEPNEDRVVLTSALSEAFLRRLDKQGYIAYKSGQEMFLTSEDDPKLKPMDDKMKARLEKVQDLVLFRYGSTGVLEAITRAVELRKYVPVYPVKNLTSLSSDKSSGKVFQECNLVPPGTTVRGFASMISSELEKHYLYAEGLDGRRIAEDDVIEVGKNTIIKFTTAAVTTSGGAGSGGAVDLP